MEVSYGPTTLMFDKCIGKGSYGKVYTVKNNDKVYKRLKPYETNSDGSFDYNQYDFTIIREASIYHEINDIRNIVSVNKLYIYSSCILYEMDHAGDTLHDLIKTNSIDIGLIKNVLSSVSLCMIDANNKFIVNGDIKPQNIMLKDKTTVKLTDWSISRINVDLSSINEFEELQTMWYRAPERLVLIDHNNYKMDVWSLGVIAVEMLLCKTGFFPFDNEKNLLIGIIRMMGYENIPERYIEKIKQSNIDINYFKNENCKLGDVLDTIKNNPEYEDVIDLVYGMLQMDPNKRFDFVDVYNHKFLNNVPVRRKSVTEKLNNMTYNIPNLNFIESNNVWYIDERDNMIKKIKKVINFYNYNEQLISLSIRLLDLTLSTIILENEVSDYCVSIVIHHVIVYNSSKYRDCFDIFKIINSCYVGSSITNNIKSIHKQFCEKMSFRFNVHTGIYYHYILQKPTIDFNSKTVNDFNKAFIDAQSDIKLLECNDESLARIATLVTKTKNNLCEEDIEAFLISLNEFELNAANNILELSI